MIARRFCGRCGTDCRETGARRCDCETSELGRVVLAAVRLAGPESTPRDVRTWLRRVAAERRSAS